MQVPVADVEGAAPEIPARAFRVVCDNMLQGLARSLRLLGADVLALGNSEDHRRAAEVSGRAPRGLSPVSQPRALLGAAAAAWTPRSPDAAVAEPSWPRSLGHCTPVPPNPSAVPAARAHEHGPLPWPALRLREQVRPRHLPQERS